MSEKTSKTTESSAQIPREAWGIFVLVCAIFIFACAQFPNATGLLGHWIVILFSHLIGSKGLRFLPLFLSLTSLSFITKTMSPKRIALSSTSFFAMFLVMLEAHYQPIPAAFWPIPTSIYGGWMGLLLYKVMFTLIGKIGTWLSIVGIGCVSLILLFDLSVKNISASFAHRISAFLKARQPAHRAQNPSSESSYSAWRNRIIRSLFYTKIPEAYEPHAKPKPAPQSLPIETDIAHLTSSSIEDPFSIDEDVLAPVFYTAPTPETLPTEKPKRVAQPTLISDNEEFALPLPTLLKAGEKPNTSNTKAVAKHQQEQAKILEDTLASFHVEAKVVNITTGPSVTRFELKPGDGVKISKILALSKDIALKLAAPDIRIEAPIPGKALVGIEVPNLTIDTVTMRMIMESSDFFQSPSKLMAVIGLTITGESIVMDLGKMPHVLIAGATGSGKSVCINAIILSILMKSTPEDVKFLMIDPKKVELSLYQDIPHLLAPVVTNPHKAAATLKKWALIEMENRYELFSLAGVKDIAGYNQHLADQRKKQRDGEAVPPKLPYIVVVIDELADLMMVAAQDVEQTICRLAQMARATGIHLVVATQRPSVNVVTGLIKANIPSRISFFLQSQIDSRTIIDMPGAEKLLGKGDMLYSPVGSFKPKRVQGVFVSEAEVKAVVEWLKRQKGPDYLHEIMDVEPLGDEKSESERDDDDEPLYNEAKQLVMSTKYASTSYLQRKLRIGYNRAARIMDQLEQEGVIAEYAGEKKARSVI